MRRERAPRAPLRSQLGAHACLAAILVFALAARVWGSFIGLPHAYLPDEQSKLDAVEQLREHGRRSEENQPGFLPLSLVVVHEMTRPLEAALRGARLPAGHDLDDPGGRAARLWIARLWLDLLSAATVVIVYVLARRIAGVGAGLLAAALLACAPLAIASANYVKEDTPVTLWLTATLLAALQLGRRRTPLAALLAGATAGLALGSKYVGVAALPLVALGLLIPPAAPAGDGDARTPDPSVRPARATPTRNLVALVAVGCCAALLAITPALILDPATVVRGIVFQLRYAASGHHDGIAVPISETWGLLYLRSAILPSLGVPAVVIALWGLVVLLRDDRRIGWLLAASTLGFLIVVEALPAKPYPFFARYALPAIPGLCVLAGVGCARIVARRGSGVAVAAVLVVGVLAWPLAQTLRFAATMYPDTRDQAAAWLMQNVDPGSWVLATPYAPMLPPRHFKTWPLAGDRASRRIVDGPAAKVVVLSDLYTTRFAENPEDVPERAAFFASLAGRGEEIAHFATSGPRFGFYNPTISVRRIAGENGSTMRAADRVADAPTGSPAAP